MAVLLVDDMKDVDEEDDDDDADDDDMAVV